MRKLVFLLLINTFFIACQTKPKQPKQATSVKSSKEKLEAREDSLELVAAYAAQDKIEHSVFAQVETKAIKAASEDDAADDPAIWVNPADPSKSLIYGSNKKGGLAVYNLQGVEVAYYPLGNINNVDVLYNFPYKDSLITVLGCSNRSYQSIDLLRIDATGKLHNIASERLSMDTSLIDDIYGFCFAKDTPTKKSYAIINGKNGLLQQFEMSVAENGIQLNLKRSIQFDSQTEGMVADNQYGLLYVGEEEKGIWKLAISPDSIEEKKFVAQSGNSNPNIAYDIEGLSLYKEGEGGFLIASSQGNFSYAVFDRQNNNEYLGSFKIKTTKDIDGVEETDGLDFVSDSLSVHFPKGIAVFQDGFNYNGAQLVPQNFKYVNVVEVLDIFAKK